VDDGWRRRRHSGSAARPALAPRTTGRGGRLEHIDRKLKRRRRLDGEVAATRIGEAEG
jgi:hypothetical protein